LNSCLRRSLSGPSKGFTLVEVMVVLMIITLMGAIAVPTLLSRVENARVDRVRADFNTMESALKLYRLDNFSYPTEQDGLEALVSEPSTARAWRGPYLDEVPTDPWGTEYQYRFPSSHGNDFDLYSFGADGIEGGNDTDADLGDWE
jgi:general secretion pathway protein G